ncbi:MAG: hypothetical protein R3C49_18775 [Planctomycetaceae bacterium]
MNRGDFRRLIGASSREEEYLPVACLLSSGYGCVGYYSSLANDGLEETCLLLNARLVELQSDDTSRTRVSDFNDFIEDVVKTHYRQTDERSLPDSERSGSSIPLTAIPFREIALVYPVAHITSLLKKAHQETPSVAGSIPGFLDFDNRSLVLKVLRAKLW